MGENVGFLNFQTQKWEEGLIVKKIGQVLYLVKSSTGTLQIRHFNQLKSHSVWLQNSHDDDVID